MRDLAAVPPRARGFAQDWPVTRVPERGEQVLVVAPHPDDEALGAAGLIHRAVRRGAGVRAVFLTSGDGFALCAAERYRCWPTAAIRRRLAVEREGEARAALARLGVAAEQVTFLRLPDGALERLWRPSEAGTPGTSELLRGLDRCLAPPADYVYYPDGADDHPDHQAAHHLVRAAIARGAAAGGVPPRELTYLIHYGRWPWPFARSSDRPLLPPPALCGNGDRWEVLPLAPEEIAVKREAIRAHASQQRLMGYFLPAFIRPNELFRRGPDR